MNTIPARPRPVHKPATPAAGPTVIRTPRDTGLFRGWGVTL